MQVAEQRLFDLSASSKALGNISEWTLRRHVRQGTVKVVRIGTRIFSALKKSHALAKRACPRCRRRRVAMQADNPREIEVLVPVPQPAPDLGGHSRR